MLRFSSPQSVPEFRLFYNSVHFAANSHWNELQGKFGETTLSLWSYIRILFHRLKWLVCFFLACLFLNKATLTTARTLMLVTVAFSVGVLMAEVNCMLLVSMSQFSLHYY